MSLKYRGLRQLVAVLIVVVSLLIPHVAPASEASDASIKQGIEAYEAGEYQKALEYFAEAIRLGATQAGLYYDIGVTHYRLKQYDQADEAFEKVAQSPAWEALALYNRALIAYRRNQPDLAKQYAKQSISLANTTNLAALNSRLLDRLENGSREKSAWSKLIHLGLGYNDNVLVTEAGASAISGEGDTFVDFTGQLKGSVSPENPNKLNYLLLAQVRDYTNLNAYDQMSLRAGVENELGRPNRSVGAFLEQVFLGGKGYELITSLEYKQPLAVSGNNPLGLKYSFNHYSILDSNFAFLGGMRHRLQLEKEKKLGKGSFETYVRGEYNDREDETSAGDFFSYSPLRVGLGAIYKKNLSSRRLFSGSLFLEQSRFMDPDVRSGVVKTRDDTLLEVRLSLFKASTTNWLFRTSYLGTVNNSNYSEFTYNQNIVSFDIFKTF